MSEYTAVNDGWKTSDDQKVSNIKGRKIARIGNINRNDEGRPGKDGKMSLQEWIRLIVLPRDPVVSLCSLFPVL